MGKDGGVFSEEGGLRGLGGEGNGWGFRLAGAMVDEEESMLFEWFVQFFNGFFPVIAKISPITFQNIFWINSFEIDNHIITFL